MTTKELTCINCPLGCHLVVEMDEDKNVISVSGNSCGRGITYAKAEVKDPRRVVCSTVRIAQGSCPVLPVKTEEAIPKDAIFAAMKEINQVDAQAPVHVGQVLKENLAGTGINLVATQNINRI